MNISSIGLSNAVNEDIGINVMKKVKQVQEQQMQAVLAGMEQGQSMQIPAKMQNTNSQDLAKELGVGININTKV